MENMKTIKTTYGGTCNNLSHLWHRHLEVELCFRDDEYLQKQEEKAFRYFEDLHRQEYPACLGEIYLT